MTSFGTSLADRARIVALCFCQSLWVGLACLPVAAQAVGGENNYGDDQEVVRLFRQREEARASEMQRGPLPYFRPEDHYWSYQIYAPVLLNPPPPYCRPPGFTPPPPCRYCPRRLPLQ